MPIIVSYPMKLAVGGTVVVKPINPTTGALGVGRTYVDGVNDKRNGLVQAQGALGMNVVQVANDGKLGDRNSFWAVKVDARGNNVGKPVAMKPLVLGQTELGGPGKIITAFRGKQVVASMKDDGAADWDVSGTTRASFMVPADYKGVVEVKSGNTPADAANAKHFYFDGTRFLPYAKGPISAPPGWTVYYKDEQGKLRPVSPRTQFPRNSRVEFTISDGKRIIQFMPAPWATGVDAFAKKDVSPTESWYIRLGKDGGAIVQTQKQFQTPTNSVPPKPVDPKHAGALRPPSLEDGIGTGRSLITYPWLSGL